MPAECQNVNIRQANADRGGFWEFGKLIRSPLFSGTSARYIAILVHTPPPDDSSRGEPVMPNLVWDNFLAGWLCLVLLSLALGIYIYSDKQRPHDIAWRYTVAGVAISAAISVFMLLYDISVWISIH